MRLFHVSEEAEITTFEPRPNKKGVPAVWAIGEPRLHNYLFPRNCPRLTFWAGTRTTRADREYFLSGSSSVVAIESGWFTRCTTTTLYLYEFDPAPFEPVDEIAGYYTTTRTVRPLGKHQLSDLFPALLERDVELRVLPTLWYLREKVLESTLDFSIIRMRNAAPPPPGFQSAFPSYG